MNIEKDEPKDATFTQKNFLGVQFSQYNTPKFSETPGKDYISYGQDNMYPNYLIESLNKSATHNAIIETKTKEIFGDGLQVEDSEDKDQLSKLRSLIEKCNKSESLNDIMRKIIFDKTVFGGFALQLIWSRDRTTIAEIHHIDFSSIRVGKPNEDGEITHYLVSDNWKKANTQKKFAPKYVAKFDLGNRIEPCTIMYVKPYRANTVWYPLPDYIGAMNDIENEYQISNYQLNSVKNGLSPSMIINFNNGQPTLPEREEIHRTIQNTFAGSDAAGKFMLFFNKNKDSAAEIIPQDMGNLDKIYTVLREGIVQSICTGHRVTSTGLVGISTAGSLGTSQELLLASELFYNKVIGPEQLMIEEVINSILKVNGFTLKVEFRDIQPVTFQISEQTMVAIMTADEIRKKIGLPALTDEQKKELGKPLGSPIVTELPTSGDSVTTEQSAAPVINDAVKNMTGKQHQQMLRIIRQFGKDQITRETATVLLKTGLGLSDDDINAILGDDSTDEDMNIQAAPSVKPYTKEVEKKK